MVSLRGGIIQVAGVVFDRSPALRICFEFFAAGSGNRLAGWASVLGFIDYRDANRQHKVKS